MKWELLHLTDIHFGDLPLDGGRYPPAAEHRDNLKRSVQGNLEVFFKDHPHDKARFPDALVITGDITIRGNKDAMMDCVEALQPSADLMNGDKRIVAIVPGNHDVTWRLSRKQENLFNKKFSVFKEVAVTHLKARTSLLPVGGLGKDGNDAEVRFSLKHKPVAVDHERKLVIICINSAMRCGELYEPPIDEAEKYLGSATNTRTENLRRLIRDLCTHDIADVTEAQRIRLGKEIQEEKAKAEAEKKDWRSYLRVAILHHHLVGNSELATEHKPFELTVDAPKVLQLLADHDVHLVLTGHKHQPYAQRHVIQHRDARDREIIIAGGATVLGALPEQGGIPRGFNLVSVSRDDKRGDFTFDFCVLPLGTDQEFQQTLKAARTNPTSMPWHRPLTLKAQPSTRTSRKTGILPGEAKTTATLPGNKLYHFPQRVRVHKPVRIYSGVTLDEYCQYCKELAGASERLFTLLTIEPYKIVEQISQRSGIRNVAQNQAAFIDAADDPRLHYKAYREHKDSIRIIVYEDNEEWMERNRQAWRPFKWLNGDMRCIVVEKRTLIAADPKIFLMDHTAVDNQICMFDAASELMTLGELNNLTDNGYDGFFRLDFKAETKRGFIPLDLFLTKLEGTSHVQGN